LLNLQKSSQRLSGAYFSKLTVTVKPYIKNIRIFLSSVAVKPPTLGGGYKATCTL